mgnify:CR=1 FL=1
MIKWIDIKISEKLIKKLEKNVLIAFPRCKGKT